MDKQYVPFNELKLVQTESQAEQKSMFFSGYGAVFNNVDAYNDIILPGAFAKCLNEIKTKQREWPLMLSQHGGDAMTPVGLWTDLSEDSHGLKVQGQLADTERGRELYALMKMQPRPAISGLSIGYRVNDFEPGGRNGSPRKLKEIELCEISLVTFPANEKARIDAVKGLNIRDVERALRDAGLSRSQAKAILSKGFMGIPQWEVEGKSSMIAEIINRNTALLRA